MSKETVKQFLNKYQITVRAVVLAMVPLICAVIACALEGKTIFDVYIPSSEWNDELFYYKLTEGVIHYGIPQGYFGFNESHGMYLSFAAWSPVLLFPWVIWGMIFGWNILSPVLCNIVIMMLAMFFFAKLARPDWKQVLYLAVPYALCTQFTRFTLSGMPEVTHWALAMIIVGLFLSHQREEKTWKLVTSIVLIMLLTWMRPYFILLLFLPAYYWIRKNKWGILGMTGVLAITGGVYWAINHFLSAAYLTDLFYTDWVDAFGEKGFFGGLQYLFWKLGSSLIFIIRMCIQVVRTGYASGGLYAGFLMISFFLFVAAIVQLFNWKKQEDHKEFLLQLQLLICFAGFFAADLLMYRLQEGGRHVLAFMAMGLCALSVASGKQIRNYLRSGVIILGMIFLYMVRANTPYDFQIPYRTVELENQIADMQEQMESVLEMTTTNTPNFDNTVVWLLWDYVDGEIVKTKWQQYYSVPQGYGINLCEAEYIINNFDSVQCRYLTTVPGGDVDKLCQKKKIKLIAENEDIRVYDMRLKNGIINEDSK